ncbi:hypothetical protein BH09MYX1_BH09MYX1_33910 [soil metagenome]
MNSPRLRLVHLSPLALVALAALACGEATPSPASPSTIASNAAVAPQTPLFVSDEIAEFGTPNAPVTTIAIDDAGNVYVASAKTSGYRAGALAMYDAALAARWSVDLAFVPRGVLALGGNRVLAYGSGAETKSGDVMLGVVDSGVLKKEVLASTLLGVPCDPTSGDSSFVREASGAALTLHCDKQPDAWRRIHLSADLAVVATDLWDSRAHFGPDGAKWFPWNDERYLGVTRYPTTTGTDAFRQPLGEIPKSEGSAIYRAFALAGNGDAIVSGTLVTASPDAPTWARRYATRTVVARISAGSAWTTELGTSAATADPMRLGSVMTPSDGAILVGFDHGEPAHVGNANLPLLGSVASALPEAERAYAIDELDGKSGAIRAVTSLRPKQAPSWMSYPRGMLATPAFVFVQRDKIVTVHPRKGQPIASVAEAVTPPIPALAPAVAADGATGGPLEEAWSELCGPRWKTKGNGPCRLEHVAIGRDGTVAAAGGYYLDNQIGTRKLPRSAYETGLLVVYERDGKLRFQRTVGVSWHNQITQVIVTDDGKIVITGIHANGFSIEGKTLPPREVPVIKGQDMDFAAYTPYVAIFDAKGKLALLEDTDVLVQKTASKSHRRACWTQLARGSAPDAIGVLASCGMGEDPLAVDDPERGTFRFSIHGTTAGAAARVPIQGDAISLTLARDGTLFGATQGMQKRVVGFSGGKPRSVPFTFGFPLGVLPTDDTLWAVGSIREGGSVAGVDALVVSKIARDLSQVEGHVLGSSNKARIDGFTVDEQGRPLVSVRYEAALTIAGRAIPAPPSSPYPDGGPPMAHLLVRMAIDGAHVERVLVLQGKPNGCTLPGFSQLTNLKAQSGLIAMTYTFGVSPKCNIGDESSTVMAFVAPP